MLKYWNTLVGKDFVHIRFPTKVSKHTEMRALVKKNPPKLTQF